MATVKKLTKEQIAARARKAAQAHVTRAKEFPGAVVWAGSGADPDDWVARVLMSDLPADARARVERKLSSLGFAPAAECGVDGLTVSGDNKAAVWLMPADVYREIHAERKAQRAREMMTKAGSGRTGPAQRVR